LKIKLKGLHLADVAEIQEAVTDKLKKVQNGEFSAAFQKVYDRAKACIYANRAYFEFKKVWVFFMRLRFKKISPKTFGPHCVCFRTRVYIFALS
jgi:hypothetical protein